MGRQGAITLFVERAAAADSRFAMTDDTASIVAEICRLLQSNYLLYADPERMFDRIREMRAAASNDDERKPIDELTQALADLRDGRLVQFRVHRKTEYAFRCPFGSS